MIQAIREGDAEAADLAGRRDAEIIRIQLVALLSGDEGSHVKLA